MTGEHAENNSRKDKINPSLKEFVQESNILQTPARMAILLFLLPRGSASFNMIRRALGLTAGNLSSHLKRLEKEDFISIEKKFQNAKPVTIVYITMHGRSSIVRYAKTLSSLLKNYDIE